VVLALTCDVERKNARFKCTIQLPKNSFEIHPTFHRSAWRSRNSYTRADDRARPEIKAVSRANPKPTSRDNQSTDLRNTKAIRFSFHRIAVNWLVWITVNTPHTHEAMRWHTGCRTALSRQAGVADRDRKRRAAPRRGQQTDTDDSRSVPLRLTDDIAYTRSN
jgi:hypothetical protein